MAAGPPLQKIYRRTQAYNARKSHPADRPGSCLCKGP